MMRFSVVILGFAGLSACAPAPISNVEAQRREAALTGQGSGPGIVTVYDAAASQQPVAAPAVVTTQDIGADLPPNPLVRVDDSMPVQPVEMTQNTAVQAAPRNSGISDEQDFNAVSARETIESDAARREQLAAQYQVVQPGALPTRDASSGPNIVAYALQTSNVPGQALYTRAFGSERKMMRNCAKFSSDDAAQREFLIRGGPQRDRLGMDPDGDGFACAWDPRPFRAVSGG